MRTRGHGDVLWEGNQDTGHGDVLCEGNQDTGLVGLCAAEIEARWMNDTRQSGWRTSGSSCYLIICLF